VNGILKAEFALDKGFHCFEQAQVTVDEAINTYNRLRPHASCNYLTPETLLSGKNGKLKYVRGFMGLVDVFLTL
jgi:transposase InsO family protein